MVCQSVCSFRKQVHVNSEISPIIFRSIEEILYPINMHTNKYFNGLMGRVLLIYI